MRSDSAEEFEKKKWKKKIPGLISAILFSHFFLKIFPLNHSASPKTILFFTDDIPVK
jgi:hypothetical protein